MRLRAGDVHCGEQDSRRSRRPCYDDVTAELSRRYNDLNVLCLSGDMLGDRLVDRLVEIWLNTPFEGGRHARRIKRSPIWNRPTASRESRVPLLRRSSARRTVNSLLLRSSGTPRFETSPASEHDACPNSSTVRRSPPPRRLSCGPGAEKLLDRMFVERFLLFQLAGQEVELFAIDGRDDRPPAARRREECESPLRRSVGRCAR